MKSSTITHATSERQASPRIAKELSLLGGIVAQFAIAAIAPAQVVTGVSGSAVHGSQLTVSGSGFGTKATSRPVAWDPCSTAGLSSQWSGGWPNASANAVNNVGCRPPIRGISMPHSNSSMYVAGSHAENSSAEAGWNVLVYKTRTISSYPAYTYASWYQRSDGAWTFCSDNNYKVFDFSDAIDPYAPDNWYIEYNPRPTSPTSSLAWHLNDDSAGLALQNPNSWWGGNAVNPMGGAWTKVELEIRYASDSTGYIHLWENGVLKVNYAGKTDGYPGTTRSEAIGGYARCSGYATNWRYFSDLYLDYSRARVMLANNINYSAATIVEPQLVDSWSDSSITLTVNRGTLPASQPAYLFVVTDAGVRSAVGVAVTSGPVPNPPTNFRAN